MEPPPNPPVKNVLLNPHLPGQQSCPSFPAHITKKPALGKEVPREFKKVEEYVEKVYDFYYNYSAEKFIYLAEALPHFTWFTKIKNSEVRSDLKMFMEYLVQMARMIKGLQT